MKTSASQEYHNNFVCKDCGMERIIKSSGDERQATKVVDMMLRLHKKKCPKNNRLTQDDMLQIQNEALNKHTASRTGSRQIKVQVEVVKQS